MKAQRLLVVVTFVNLALVVFALAQTRPALAADVPQLLRGRGLEIVEAEGRGRASISVMPAGTSAHGDRYPETVLLRLITERGRPSVKISASEEASGVSLAGPSGTSNTYVILEAKGTTTALTMKN